MGRRKASTCSECRCCSSACCRISHTHGPRRTPGNRNLLTRKTVTREARVPTDLTACRMGDTDFQLVAVKEQVSRVRHHARWRRRSGNADLRSAQRPAGPRAAHCRPPSRGAGMGPAALRTVSAIPMYGSRRTLGFPPRRNHLATGGPSRRPPSAGCAGPHRENWPEVGVPLPARRSAWWLGRRAPCSASAWRLLRLGERSRV